MQTPTYIHTHQSRLHVAGRAVHYGSTSGRWCGCDAHGLCLGRYRRQPQEVPQLATSRLRMGCPGPDSLYPLSLSLSLSCSQALSPSQALSLSRSCSLALSQARSLSFSLVLSLARALSLFLFLSPPPPFSHFIIRIIVVVIWRGCWCACLGRFDVCVVHNTASTRPGIHTHASTHTQAHTHTHTHPNTVQGQSQ